MYALTKILTRDVVRVTFEGMSKPDKISELPLFIFEVNGSRVLNPEYYQEDNGNVVLNQEFFKGDIVSAYAVLPINQPDKVEKDNIEIVASKTLARAKSLELTDAREALEYSIFPTYLTKLTNFSDVNRDKFYVIKQHPNITPLECVGLWYDRGAVSEELLYDTFDYYILSNAPHNYRAVHIVDRLIEPQFSRILSQSHKFSNFEIYEMPKGTVNVSATNPQISLVNLDFETINGFEIPKEKKLDITYNVDNTRMLSISPSFEVTTISEIDHSDFLFIVQTTSSGTITTHTSKIYEETLPSFSIPAGSYDEVKVIIYSRYNWSPILNNQRIIPVRAVASEWVINSDEWNVTGPDSVDGGLSTRYKVEYTLMSGAVVFSDIQNFTWRVINDT